MDSMTKFSDFKCDDNSWIQKVEKRIKYARNMRGEPWDSLVAGIMKQNWTYVFYSKFFGTEEEGRLFFEQVIGELPDNARKVSFHLVHRGGEVEAVTIF